MGLPLEDAEYLKAFDDFYRYFDLSNEQVFLESRGRVSKETWEMWASGIESNMQRPAFVRAWQEVSRKTNNADFSELRTFLESKGIKAPETILSNLESSEPAAHVDQRIATR